MAASAPAHRTHRPRQTGPGAGARLLRFDRVERAAHWANAVLFAIVMCTALPLYFGQIEALIGRRALVEEIHVYAGLALPVPLLISLAGSWGRRMRDDMRRFALWRRDEVRWLLALGRRPVAAFDKFNPGQKMNALFTGGAIVVMLGTGCVMKWFGLFPVSWRAGATFVHDVLAWAIFIIVAGHIGFALTHRDALRSMVRGWIPEAWAERHANGWLAEQRSSRSE